MPGLMSGLTLADRLRTPDDDPFRQSPIQADDLGLMPGPPYEPTTVNEIVSDWATRTLPMWARPGQVGQFWPDDGHWGNMLPYPLRRERKKGRRR